MEKVNSAWSQTQQWLHEATNTVEVLPGDRKQGEAIFQQLQVSPRSLLGTIALETGVYSLDPTGTLYALDRASGEVRTTVSVGATSRFATPTLYEGRVFVGTLTGVVAVIVS